MGNRRLYKIEFLHRLGTPEFERLKVPALNLFHPTASPSVLNMNFFILRHSHVVKGVGGFGILFMP
jgi:hypothetical protein